MTPLFRTFALALLLTLPAQAAALGGTYTVTGVHSDGQPYRSVLTVTPLGTAYRFSWDDGAVVGTGLKLGQRVAVAYGDLACGVAAYELVVPGVYTGRWANSAGETGTEDLVFLYHTDFVVRGTNPDRSAYRGTLSTTLNPTPAFALNWRIAGETTPGVGFHRGDVLGAAWGNEGCGVALYTLEGDGTLQGQYATADDVGTGGQLGTEMARPQ